MKASIEITLRGSGEQERNTFLNALGYELTYPTPIIGQAPGTLKNHYAPQTPLYLLKEPLPQMWWSNPGLIQWEVDHLSTAYLTWSREIDHKWSACLTPQGDPVEAASRLFKLMRLLDQSSAQQIYVEPIPHRGLGRAIADRSPDPGAPDLVSRKDSGVALSDGCCERHKFSDKITNQAGWPPK